MHMHMHTHTNKHTHTHSLFTEAREDAINSAVAQSALNANANMNGQRGKASSRKRQIHHPLFANMSYKEAEDR